MSLHKGSLNIGEVYKGNLPIAQIFKGSNLVWEKSADFFEYEITEFDTNRPDSPYGDGSTDTRNRVDYITQGLTPISYTENNGTYVPNIDNVFESWVNDHFTPVMLKSDGTVDYELDRTDQNYKADGVTPSDIANINYDGNAMLKIKKFYISCSIRQHENNHLDVGKIINIKISDKKIDNTFTCWGFVDANGVEQDYVYYSLFHCHKDSNNKLRSISNINLSSNSYANSIFTYSNAVAYAKENGTGWDISNLALENAIGLVLMMLYKDINPMFVNREKDSRDGYKQNPTVYSTTGTRASEGGFPYSLKTQQQKTLWIESYWTSCYNNGVSASVWVNGLASTLNPDAPNNNYSLNNYLLHYKLNPPYDLSDISSWSLMNNTDTYAYQSNSHYITQTTLYDNLLFPADEGQIRNGMVADTMLNTYYGDVEIDGGSRSYHADGVAYPCKTCGSVMVDYTCPAHFLSYCAYGNRPSSGNNKYQEGAARLIYMPQS